MNSLFNSQLCIRCKGRGYCGKSCPILAKFPFLGKAKTHFSGSSPPEIFVGRVGYPEINTGILAPDAYGNTEEYSMPELWHSKNLTIEDILAFRSKLIYARFKSNIKDARKQKKFLSLMQEISMADKKVDTEFILKKPPKYNLNIDTHTPIIGNPAPLKYARLEENPSVPKKIDYLTGDTDIKASTAINELYKADIQVSNIIKVLSAGLLGIGVRRKLVPTRWAITSVDSTISKQLMKEIRYFPLIGEYLVFSDEYLGNHYEILLIPRFWSYEVIEAKIPGSIWNISGSKTYVMQDYEGFYDRKDYAEEVAGGYYSPRLAISEYLTKIRRQASVLVLREVKPTYTAPLGVGILRETVRSAFRKIPRKFNTLKEAFEDIKTYLTLPIELFIDRSQLLKELSQKTLIDFTR